MARRGSGDADRAQAGRRHNMLGLIAKAPLSFFALSVRAGRHRLRSTSWSHHDDRRNFSSAPPLWPRRASACDRNIARQRAPSRPISPNPHGAGANARLGVFARDTGSGRSVAHDENIRSRCLHFQSPLALPFLAQVDPAARLDQEVCGHRVSSQLASRRAALSGGSLASSACAAIVEVSNAPQISCSPGSAGPRASPLSSAAATTP